MSFTVVRDAGDSDSGVAAYDVQVKVDGGGWTDWLTATTDTEAIYSGELGHRYTFRARATDHVGNTGDWAEASTVVVQVTKYYHFGAQRIAMRRGDVVYYLHADHLGSVSVVSDGSGALLAAQRYLPYGETRHATGVPPTDFGFTGQRNEGTIGLYDYRARFYDPTLGRFVSADTVVPNPGNPQDLNRYAYVRNNPLRYTDPSGHYITLYGEPGVRYAGLWSQDRRELAVRIDSKGQIHILRGGTEFVNPVEQGLANYYATGNEAYLPESGGALEGMIGYAANNAAAGSGYERPFTSLANRLVGGHIDPIWIGIAGMVARGGDEDDASELPPAGERLGYTETPWDTARRGPNAISPYYPPCI